MNKYYFLLDKTRKFSVGPFITVEENDDIYIGQIIRSNDFSVKYDNNTVLDLELYYIFSEYNLLRTKYYIQSNLKTLNNIEKICDLDIQIDMQTGIVTKEILNKQYSLKFKIVDDIIMCPLLEIKNLNN
jgi:hypothetical protein